MQILVVSERTCVRTLKQIIALSKSHKVHLITKRMPYGDWCETITRYDGTSNQLRRALKLYKHVDLVHVHNEPGWVMWNVKEVLPNKKIILDIHDSMIWRSKNIKHRSSEERLMFNWADGIVVPSKTCQRLLKPEVHCLVLPPYCNEFVYQDRSWGWKGGIVYQGRVDLPDAAEFMGYCKMDKTAKVFDKAKIPFHIYMPGKEKDLSRWRELYEPICIFHKGLQYEEMLSAMGFYDWGLCGNVDKFRDWDVAMPNKLFEYMAGGIPIIALNCKEVGRFVEKHGVGISVSNVSQIKERWDEREGCQRNVMLKRYEFTMEKHIYKLEELYRCVLK